jgi:peptide/nickel transport system substrate-binding protein
MPKHLLERPFTENKATFTEIPYWTSEFVSSGAYRLREWSAGSHAILEAFPDYVLGRPKIDVVEVKFISDPSTLLANVLTGTVELTFTRAVSIEQAIPVRDQWRDGTIVPYINGWTMMYPQHRAPSPMALGDAQFRRALTHAIDRQQIADTLTAGFAQVADSIIAPNQPEYRSVESSIARFPYDPRRSAQLIEGMGFVKAGDGFYRDPAGQRPVVEIRTTTNDANQKSTFAIADFFQRVGIGAEPVVIPVARLQDREYRVLYTGLELVNQPHGPDGFEDLMYSPAAPLPERGYRAPNSNKNRGSYINPEYDALMDRYKMTIPMADRMRVMAQLIQQQTDLQLVMGIFYTVDAIMMGNRVDGVQPGSSWNAQAWDTKA